MAAAGLTTREWMIVSVTAMTSATLTIGVLIVAWLTFGEPVRCA